MSVVSVRRLAGTITPHLTSLPMAAELSGFRPTPDGDLSGAACATVDPDLFFPEDGDAFGERRAKAICATCPVRAACLAAAIERAEPVGIFGGLTEQERGLPKWEDAPDADRPAPAVPAPVPHAVTDALRLFVADLTQQARQQRPAAPVAAVVSVGVTV